MTGVTSAPGRAFCIPFTITRSPGSRPASTIHSPARRLPVSIFRTPTRFSSSTTKTVAPSWLSITDSSGMTIRLSVPPEVRTTVTYIPGRSARWGFGKVPRTLSVPVVGLTLGST